jgi:hypothetical protein
MGQTRSLRPESGRELGIGADDRVSSEAGASPASAPTTASTNSRSV